MTHREEQSFVIQLHLSAEFGDDYEGEEDGYAWHQQFTSRVRPRVIAAVIDALRSEPGWSAVASPRGRAPEDAVDIDVQRVSQAARGNER